MGLKILHSADWHLDSPFGSFSAQQQAQLQEAQETLPEKIADVCRREDCDLMLLAGDIFDGPYRRETAKRLYDALARCGVPVFIAPGNHDFCGPGSPWTEESWPENVHIFTGALSCVDLPELDVRVYGAGYSGMDCPALLEDFHAEGNMRYRVAVLHGDAVQSKSPYCPITSAQVRRSGLDYLALGHIHRGDSFQAGETLCLWPGCPMGRGWDELGEKGLCIVTLEETPEIRFVQLDTPTFREYTLDIEGGSGEVLETVLPPVATDDFIRVNLIGSGSVNVGQWIQHFSHIPNLELRDRTEAPVDLWQDAGEDSLRGTYFRMLQQASEAAEGRDARRIRLAAEISRKLLEGKEVALP